MGTQKQPLISDKDIEDGKYTVADIDEVLRSIDHRTHPHLIDFWLDIRNMVTNRIETKAITIPVGPE